MKKYCINAIIAIILEAVIMTTASAQNPLFTFSAPIPQKVTVSSAGTETVTYTITSNTKYAKQLVLQTTPPKGFPPTPGLSSSGCYLPAYGTCTLTINIDGSKIPHEGIHSGPYLCQADSNGNSNPNQCYQPSRANSLSITKESNAGYSIGGSVVGLSGSLVLEDNGGDALVRNADGTFTFANALPAGSTYSVTVAVQPASQLCTVSNGNGVITNANVTNVQVHCSTNIRTVGGNISGLASSGAVVLQNNGGDALSVSSNGFFTFSTPVAQGANYNVTVLTQPANQTCTVTNGSGTAGTSNITSVQVTCSTNAYTLGGTVSGLSGTVILHNGVDYLPINSDGFFTFPTAVAQGASYNVAIYTQPTTQNCTLTNASGIMGGANITNVQVNCATIATTLSTSVSDLALSVTGLIEYGVSGTPSSGLPRTITITNTGSHRAVNLSVAATSPNPPNWPAGTISTTTCGSKLGPGISCSITVTPGSTASSDGTQPCSALGTTPVPTVVQVTADNASAVSTNVVVLSYGCIYQGGYVFALDDSTATTTSVGGKVAATTDQAPASGIVWDSSADCRALSCYITNADSTTNGTNLSTPSPGGNTYLIYNTLTTINGELASSYAAGLCTRTIATYSDWYLPAICEMGYGSNGGINCGTQAAPLLQNIQSGLVDFNGLHKLSGSYWSSTDSGNPAASAWEYAFSSNLVVTTKRTLLGGRCTRALTH